MRVCFDIDDTLYKIRMDKRDQVPDYDLIQVLRWFCQNGDDVYVWSAGGIEYAKVFVQKLGLDDIVTVVEKGSFKPDIAFDDCETKLGRVDIKVKRETTEEDIMNIAKPNVKKFVDEERLI
ncbi:MAG: hypothetical protein WC346_08470 [Methanogenium sp.]